MTTHISLHEIFEIYVHTLEGLKQQSLEAEFRSFVRHFPRDPLFIARGLEAVFGITIEFAFVDFYKDIKIPDERRDFLSFYEYAEPHHRVTVYFNKNKIADGHPLVSDQTLRFLVLKELFNAVIRAAIHRQLIATRYYPDTVEFAAFISAHLDWISEKFSIYAFGEDEYSATVSVENAAELLAVMFLVDLGALYKARKDLKVAPKPFWKLKNHDGDGDEIDPESETADLRFSLFEYEKHAKDFGVKVRFVIVLIKTDFILKIVDGLKAIVDDIKKIFFGNGN